jgi:predicted metal-dependent phosphoesterase TrpH
VTDAPAFDLQSHSTYSDGALAPAEVVAGGAAAGLELMALTDHDTVEGVDEALAAGREHGVRVIPAAELSSIDGVYDDLHVLGYGVDHHDEAFLAALDSYRADREARAGRMAAALNVERLREEGRDDVSPFIEAYLIPGRPGFRPRLFPSVEQAIEVIHDAGGLAIWAHPFWDVEAPEEVEDAIERFAGFGVDGVEAFYVTHTREQTLLVADVCERKGLLTTGSSDFHGPEHRLFSRYRAFELHGREPNLGPLGG